MLKIVSCDLTVCENEEFDSFCSDLTICKNLDSLDSAIKYCYTLAKFFGGEVLQENRNFRYVNCKFGNHTRMLRIEYQ